MRVIAYYSGDNYKVEADLLIASMRKYDLTYYVQRFPSEVDWYHGVAIKPLFIVHCRNEFSGALLFVDVDAVFHDDPSEYFDNLQKEGYDFGAHWFQGAAFGYDRFRNDDWMLSGTMFWGDTDNARKLLSEWISLNISKQRKGDWTGSGQANLATIVNSNQIPDLKIKRLPGRYCYVFDKPWAYPLDEPKIIEHTIASRENKDKSKGRVNTPRRQRIEQLREEFKQWMKT